MMFMRALGYFRKPWICITYLNRTRLRKLLPDKLVIKSRFRSEFGRKLNLQKPQTFNEKLQWLKLYNRNPEYIKFVDKFEVKQYVAEMIGESHVIPTYGVWNRIEDIDFDKLPDSFVLKTTHDSHSIVLCKDKSKFDQNAADKVLRRSLRNNYFYGGREWPYKYVKPRILAEQYMDNEGMELIDYKIHCFNGRARFVLTCMNRFSSSGLEEAFYDIEWNRIPVHRPEQVRGSQTSKPQSWDNMISMAEKISQNIPFVRVDFYEVRGVPYFGEMTFFPASGYKRFIPEDYDTIFGSYLSL